MHRGIVLFERARRTGLDGIKRSAQGTVAIASDRPDGMLPNQSWMFASLQRRSDPSGLSRRKLVRRHDCGSNSRIHRAADRTGGTDPRMDFRKKPARDPTELNLAAKTAEMQCFVLRASCFVLRASFNQAPSTKHQAPSTVFV